MMRMGFMAIRADASENKLTKAAKRAINFDRQRQGLMNEFKWSHDFSRSIGTDVRYILYLVGEYDGAKWLVDEMVN